MQAAQNRAAGLSMVIEVRAEEICPVKPVPDTAPVRARIRYSAKPRLRAAERRRINTRQIETAGEDRVTDSSLDAAPIIISTGRAHVQFQMKARILTTRRHRTASSASPARSRPPTGSGPACRTAGVQAAAPADRSVSRITDPC